MDGSQPLDGTSFDALIAHSIFQAIDHIDWHICLSFYDESPHTIQTHTRTKKKIGAVPPILKSIPFDYLSSSFANEVFIVRSTIPMSTCQYFQYQNEIDTKKKTRAKFCLEPNIIAILSARPVCPFACLFVCLLGGLRLFILSFSSLYAFVGLYQERSSRKRDLAS